MLPCPWLCSAHGGYTCTYAHALRAAPQLPWSPPAAPRAAAKLRARALLGDPHSSRSPFALDESIQAPMGAAKHLHGLEIKG